MPNQIAQLIPVTQSTISSFETLTCDGRKLHEFLEVGRDFSSWLKERIDKYDFTEGVDYVLLTKSGEQSGRGGHNRLDYTLTVDMAKQLAMVENNEKGRQIRRYFIECERRAREDRPKALPEPEPKTKRGRKAIPAPDPTERQLDGLLDRVRFYIREIAEAEKQVDAILLTERNKHRQGRFSTDCPVDRVCLNLSCSQRTLWASLDFGLKAVEENVKAVLAVARM